MELLLRILLPAALLLPGQALASDLLARSVEDVDKGNQAYAQHQYAEALARYEEAEQQVVREPRIHFNRGNALFKLGRLDAARQAYLRAMGSEDPEIRKRNHYNIANTHLHQGAFAEAVTYYRRALELDPGYEEARFNLEIALRALERAKTPPGPDQPIGPPLEGSEPNGGTGGQGGVLVEPGEEEAPEDDPGLQGEPGGYGSDPGASGGKDRRRPVAAPDHGQAGPEPGQHPGPEQGGVTRPVSIEPEGTGLDGPRETEDSRPAPRLTPEQIQNLLDAELQNERPFRIPTPVIPDFVRDPGSADKDW